MSTIYQRDIPDNFLRNGAFEHGNLSFWTLSMGWVNTTIMKTGAPCGTHFFRGFDNGGHVFIMHNDYIPVKPHEHVYLTAYQSSNSNRVPRLEIIEYTSELAIIRRLHRTFHALPTTFQKMDMIASLSPDCHFIRAQISFISGTAGQQQIACCELRISEELITTPSQESSRFFHFTRTATVPPHHRDTFHINPELGFRYNLVGINFQVRAPTGATAGNHEFILTTATQPEIFYAVVSHNFNQTTGILFNVPYPTANITRFFPNSIDAFAAAIARITATSDNRLQIIYSNNTNAAQAHHRQLFFHFELQRNQHVNSLVLR